ncbi:hypothetical protein BRC96_06900 [Halobacteriales archaeon QS_6_64_34]|nr:MAG: hypothetical protein BRC96_06900 [Halobacteriales archaeon QS_6_64_34]
MTLATQSVGSDAQNINWQSVFNQAYSRSLTFEAGDDLKHGRLVNALQDLGKAGNNATAGTIIRQAVQAGELEKTTDGYKIVRDGPGTGDIRQSLKTKLRAMMENGENGVIQSPTSSGKTYTPSTTHWRSHPEIAGEQPVVFLSGTTNARDDAITKSDESHATAKILYGRNDACPLANGEYDSGNDEGNTPISAPDGSEPSEWFTTMCKKRGLPVSVAHGKFEREHDGTLPCCENGEKCQSTNQWVDIPRNDDGEVDYDVLHATHEFAQVPQLIEDCNLIIDERPDFTLDNNTGRWRKRIKSYLKAIDAPVKRWEELMMGLTGDRDIDLDRLHDTLTEPEPDWFTTDSNAHALAPGIVEAIVTAEEQDHERWVGTTDYTYPTLNPNHEGPEQKRTIRIVFDSENDIRLLQAIPDFSEARCVIGLDAYPTMPKWEGNTLPSIEKKQIVSDDERHKWRRNQRNLTIVQVGDNKNSWTKQNYNEEKVRVLCNALRRKYGDGFTTGVTSNRFEDDFKKQLAKAGIETPDTIHFGNEKSVEDFDSERVGVVAGCISLSDEDIKDWIALLGKDATPKREVVDGYQGQAWVGEDADVAEEILADVRENGVLQACGRYARSPQQSDDGAIVFVLTNVLPDEYVDKKVDDVDVFGSKEKQILDYVASNDGVTVRTIIDNTDISKKHINDTLNKCRGYSWMQVDEGAGHYNADVFNTDCCPDGLVEV